MDEIKDLDQLKQELDASGQKVTDINVLFLDVSSTCVGYTVSSIDFTHKTSEVKETGCLWLDNNWTHAQKYLYIYNALVNYFWIVSKVDHIVIEQYSVNPNRMSGVMVIIEMIGIVKLAAEESGIKVSSILPQQWRKILEIKPDITLDKTGKKVKDYKDPAKRLVDTLFKVPDQVVSNITNNQRQTPSDLFDSACIALAWTKRLGINKIKTSNVAINPHIGINLGAQ